MHSIILGNFDGVHLGHQALLRAAANRSEVGRDANIGLDRVEVVTFDPPPISVLDPTFKLERLQSASDRVLELHRHGATRVELIRPTKELLGLSGERFITDLHQRLHFDRIVEGSDFRFGRGREGSMELLRALGTRLGFEVVEVPSVLVAMANGGMVEARSGKIRELLRAGNVGDARRILGRAFTLRAEVCKGDQRGRTIGWPTANLDANQFARHQLLLPADGVYAGFARVGQRIGEVEVGRHAIAAISVGSKPTFDGTGTTVETTLLDADGRPLQLPLDAYGWTIEIELRERLRSQVRFDTLEALLDQMELDRARIVEFATSSRGVTPS